MNRLYLKQIQTNQIEIETETDCTKSKTEIYCVKPFNSYFCEGLFDIF